MKEVLPSSEGLLLYIKLLKYVISELRPYLSPFLLQNISKGAESLLCFQSFLLIHLRNTLPESVFCGFFFLILSSYQNIFKYGILNMSVRLWSSKISPCNYRISLNVAGLRCAC